MARTALQIPGFSAPPTTVFMRLPKTANSREWPREESNLRPQIRSLPLYPLSYGAGQVHGSADPPVIAVTSQKLGLTRLDRLHLDHLDLGDETRVQEPVHERAERRTSERAYEVDPEVSPLVPYEGGPE